MSNYRYGLEEKPFKKLDVRLLYITQAHYDRDWHSVAHTHHFTELFYVTEGTGEFLVENESLSVKEGDLIVVNPNVSHTEAGYQGAPFSYIVLGVNGLQLKSDLKPHSESYSIHNFNIYQDEIFFYLKTLVKEARDMKENYEAICQNLLEILILSFVRKTHAPLIVAPTTKATKECRFIEQYLEEHYPENITLEDLSRMTYLNKYYLVHAFKEYKGTSPINYLIEKRVNESKHLLKTTNYPVSKIATLVGFSSQSYFSQVFRKETGLTPNAYRKQK